jgi:hypothetical protein
MKGKDGKRKEQRTKEIRTEREKETDERREETDYLLSLATQLNVPK